LLRRAKEVGAQMIVSGAYGHSRLREAVFGGATRDLLEAADLPILMSR
jgi:nucleotide-binding universal stress UspA family protein